MVYDRTTPVAVLQPGPRATTSDDRLIRLEKMGIVRRGKKHVSLDLLSESPPRPKREINAAALISEEREGR